MVSMRMNISGIKNMTIEDIKECVPTGWHIKEINKLTLIVEKDEDVESETE